MKLDFETSRGLQQCLTVQLSEESFNSRIVELLLSLDEGLETEGLHDSEHLYRLLEQQLDPVTREKVMHGLINASFEEAIRRSEIRLAGKPVFETIEAAPGSRFAYSAVYEVYPLFTLPDLSTFAFTQLVAEVNEQDVDRTISVIRRQESKWSLVERPAQAGDSVIINYHAQVGEKVFDGKAMRVELNSNDVVEGFDKGLTGTSAGDKLPLELYFPEDHYQAEVAGKTVIFDVEVVQVEAMVLPELDTDFIASHGIENGSIETLRNVIHSNMESHLQRIIRMKNTLTMLTDILKETSIDVPQALVEEEVARLICDPCEEVEGVESFKHDMDPAQFTDLAHKRVARSLLIAALASANGIELDAGEVRARLEDLVEEYSDKERIIVWFYEDGKRLASIESDVLGEQVADWILKTMPVEKVKTTYSEMMHLSDSATE